MTTRLTILSALLLSIPGCGGGDTAEASSHDEALAAGDESTGHHAHGESESEEEVQNPSEPVETREDGSRLYGSVMSETDVTPLATILSGASEYAGQVVKTEGEITQVCQRMGCWMEIRAEEGSPGIRVPMAGHSFFLPRDLSGSRVTVEGTVVVAELDEETRAHLAEEGGEALDQDVSIEATAVLVYAR